ncbi:vitamin K-dependent protein C-like [Pristis pectinata]|uniref:vitamin K-dependent protein C-like n=1 Tax=Pristis pectinata TaxID=685728 RepID=UPI00223D433E|nr:vitamin K-dependent protein C-like [Pristis pectinata]XP_051873727.1 vitamin K-dependent protein C-like [Pristis pectinata]XP_051873728.1 vitamin K-dependent protein C-like [Pristis pectinata]
MVKACCCLTFLVVACLVVSSYSVFLPEKKATEVLRIRKRANSFFEEFKTGDIERECHEESCDFEEVKEIFPTTDAALIFWNKHADGDQCENHPCANNATCQDLIGGYYCHCPEGLDGQQCQYALMATNCSDNYGHCAHFCKEIPERNRRECLCVNGYKLSENGYSCIPEEEYGCGYLRTVNKQPQPRVMGGLPQDPRVIGGKEMKKGSSPWQVLLMNTRGQFKCGGVLIHRFWILTAAHCVDEGGRFKVRLGEHNRTVNEKTEDTIIISEVVIHPNFTRSRLDSDIALLRLAEAAIFSDYILPVCLPIQMMAEERLLIPGNKVVVTGWGAMDENDDRIRPSTLLFIDINLVSHELCKERLGDKITGNMICAGDPSFRKDACKGDSGGPMVIVKNGTWFLLGLVSWGEGCGQYHKFGVYTKVSNFLDWIYSVTKI